MYTKGKWWVDPNYDWVRGKDRGVIANCTGYDRDEQRGNAKLIVSAVNACIKLNPDNPQAVAESIGDMYEALKELWVEVGRVGFPLGIKPQKLVNAMGRAMKSLQKADGRE